MHVIVRRLRHTAQSPLFIGGFFFLTIFGLFFVFQHLSFSYYIFEESQKREHILLLRTLGVSLLFLSAYLIAVTLGERTKNPWVSRSILFLLLVWILVAFVDGFILYYSGLHITPTALQHAQGAQGIMWDALTQPFVLGVLVMISALFLGLWRAHTTLAQTTFRSAVWVCSIASVVTGMYWWQANIWYTLPERLLIRSFTQQSPEESALSLSQTTKDKLASFGVHYDTDQFYLVNRGEVFSSSSPSYLPEAFQQTRPNVIILFLESFSARLTSVYNPHFSELTPNLERFAAHKDSTVFSEVYNASTPTATGLLSLLCSFYPTTSHLEIETRGSLSGHHLLCLPEVLKHYGGYGRAMYITSVGKDYADKERIFGDMGTDVVLGTEELSTIIPEKPLSWGYSDHQIFPRLLDVAHTLSDHDDQPFLLMYSTVDTHPPYIFPADGVAHADEKENVLDPFHSTDHAFGLFWDEFLASDLADTTMVVIVADHAAFPSQPIKDVFSDVEELNYFDEITFMTYYPQSMVSSTVDTRGSGVDMVPTILELLSINIPNSFEGYSLLSERTQYPNLMGMHDLGIYINDISSGSIQTSYAVPDLLDCTEEISLGETITLCELKEFYRWKKQQFQHGRFWKHTL